MQAMEDDDSGALSGRSLLPAQLRLQLRGCQDPHQQLGEPELRGDYSTQSEDADDRTSTWDQYWTYDGMTVLFAAGTRGMTGIPSRNGEERDHRGRPRQQIQHNADDEMYYYSSRGPTDDGRIKPDIVAAGDYVRSCKAQEASEAPDNINDDWYVEYSGPLWQRPQPQAPPPSSGST